MERTNKRRGLTVTEAVLGVALLAVITAVGTPFAVRARAAAQGRECVTNLTRIRDAKIQWARDHRASAAMVPADDDLFGPGRYLLKKPACPSGGTYDVNAVDQKPTCSIGPQPQLYPHRP